MPTFKTKPETVDARLVEGGRQNCTDLTHWVLSHGGHAYWAGAVGKYPEKIYLEEPSFEYTPAYVGDWIVLKQSGRFEVVRPETFEEKYVQV